MAFDETLAGRVRLPLSGTPGVIEKKMFGCLAFMIKGNMSVGVCGSELIVRVEPSEAEHALGKTGVRAFDITGRPMKGWLLIAASALSGRRSLSSWVSLGISYAKSLPAKAG